MVDGPIFVSGFSRGGTTILMNLIASHPDVCTVGESHQLFKGSNILDSPLQIASKAVFRDLPVILATGQDFLSPRNIGDRPAITGRTRNLIRRVFEQSKSDSQHEHLNRFKAPGVVYQQPEIDAARMLAKNLDGAVLITDVLREIWPNCHFVGLTRHGLAVCEGHTRRGRTATAVGKLFSRVAGKMIEDSQTMDNYQLIRFEDLMARPVEVLRTILAGLNLDPTELKHVRLQQRKMVTTSGDHRLTGDGGSEWDVCWLSPDELSDRLDPDVNERQIGQLSGHDRADFLEQAESTMTALQYEYERHTLKFEQAGSSNLERRSKNRRAA